MAKYWILLIGAVMTLAACADGRDSVFDPEEASTLCNWFTDVDIREMSDSAIGGAGSDEELFKRRFGEWGCWWQTPDGGVVLAPFTESDAHPLPDKLGLFTHRALSKGISVADWPQGDWPLQIETRTDGRGFSALLDIEAKSQLVWFSLELHPESDVDVDGALSIADEMLNRMGWIG